MNPYETPDNHQPTRTNREDDAAPRDPHPSGEDIDRLPTDADGGGNSDARGYRGPSGLGGPRGGRYGSPADSGREHDPGLGAERGVGHGGSWGAPDESFREASPSPARPGADRDHPAAPESMSDDEALCSRIHDALGQAPDIDTTGVQLTANQGVVILEGSVASEQVRERVEEITRECRGLREIHNHLRTGAAGTR